MNIGVVSTFASKCGIATYTKYLCEALAKNKIYCKVLAEKPYSDEFDPKFTTDIPYMFNWRRDKNYNQVIEKSFDFDALHIQHQFGLFPVYKNMAELYQKSKKPIITTLHDVVPPSQTDLYFKTILINSEKIIVHTNACRTLLQQYCIMPEKISLIPHGTLLTEIPNKNESRIELKIPQNAEVVMTLGFISESKGLLELIKILAVLRKTHPNTMLIHAGGLHPVIENSNYLKMIMEQATILGIKPENFRVTQ